ncbi:porin [Flavihumibacter rivuli]|uniref:outer membrane beta-barrel protein n=1 Tax=Flavihumibacter rivuli TaxID=2838156 RepID=UPI001BDE7D22|nr:outer membrane beta-barrel protein [Flavihumibacter rivuli]ULQ58141.1 porin [Flavihumibacter rivuli]
MLQKIFATGIALSLSTALFSQTPETTSPAPAEAAETSSPEPQEKKPTFTFSGFADIYYRYDFSKNASNNRSSFTNSHNSFELGMASLKLESSFGKVGMVADLGFGKRAQEFSYNESGIVASIKQLYITYAATDWLKFTGGSWATHVGYELVDAPLNRNYSMSYMFSYGPFFHTGVKADLTFGKHGFMIGIANPTDYKSAPTDSKKSVIAQYSYAFNDNWKVYLNYVGGTRPADTAKTDQFDAVISGKFSDKFSVGFNGSIFRASIPEVARSLKDDAQDWWASAVYLNFDPTTTFGLTLRSEYFNDQNQLAPTSYATQGASIWANTISANFRVGNLTIIPEMRFESASKDIYTGKDGAEKAGNASALLAAVYRF